MHGKVYAEESMQGNVYAEESLCRGKFMDEKVYAWESLCARKLCMRKFMQGKVDAHVLWVFFRLSVTTLIHINSVLATSSLQSLFLSAPLDFPMSRLRASLPIREVCVQQVSDNSDVMFM